MKKLIMRFLKRREAKKYGVPYKERMWWHYECMLGTQHRDEHPHLECFDEKGKYINCPPIGGEVTYYDKGNRYVYRIVDFDNESRDRDWLYDGDWINPICEFVRKIENI